jgi:outer membrane lipoprotein carrier protein
MRTSSARFGWAAAALVVLAVPAGPPAAGQAAPPGASGAVMTAPHDGRTDPELEALLGSFDKAQRATTTIVATFTEEKRLKLLAKPIVSRGELYFQRPNQVRWEYLEPDRKVFVITEDHYLAYYPALKRAEEVPIKKFIGRRLFRFIGLGQSIDELSQSYQFRLEPAGDLPGTRLLVLTPRKKKMRERMTEMRIWVDTTTYLPRKLQYSETDGDSTILTFHALRPNIDVAGSRFRLDLPKDVVVSDTFNGFSLGEQSF